MSTTVNGIDISVYHATLLTKDIQPAKVTVYKDWLRNALNPQINSKQETYKEIKLTLFIEDSTDDAAQADVSNFSRNIEKCILKFDDSSYFYDCTVASNESTRETIGFYSLTVSLNSSYAYLPAQSVQFTAASQTITVPGNLPTPAIVMLTPPINIISCKITGLGKDITMTNLHKGVPLIIDGEACTVTENGNNRFADYDAWGFPVLQPGQNQIGIDTGSGSVNLPAVEVRFKSKFM